MRLREIRTHEQRDPFRPFRICLSDGTHHVVPNPNLIFVTHNSVMIGVLEEGQEIPERVVYCDPLHISRVETIDSGTSSDSTDQ